MLYLILFVVLFVLIMVIGGFGCDWEERMFNLTLGLSFGISAVITLITASIVTTVSDNNCLEKNQRIIPSFVYTSDSSIKILRYDYENKNHEIQIKKDDPNFYIPESLIFVEPCFGKIQIKEK